MKCRHCAGQWLPARGECGNPCLGGVTKRGNVTDGHQRRAHKAIADAIAADDKLFSSPRKKYGSNAERQKAYRERKKAK